MLSITLYKDTYIYMCVLMMKSTSVERLAKVTEEHRGRYSRTLQLNLQLVEVDRIRSAFHCEENNIGFIF